MNFYQEIMDEVLLLNKDKMTLSKYMLTGNYHGHSNYWVKDMQSTIYCKQKFKSINGTLKFDNYNVLYCRQYVHNKLNRKFTNRSQVGPFCLIAFMFIITIQDDDNNTFYIYAKYRFKTECDTCDGKTNYMIKRMIYSDNLRDLLDFVYTFNEQQELLKRIRNGN